jgi:ketosteroid isomerase-like protein
MSGTRLEVAKQVSVAVMTGLLAAGPLQAEEGTADVQAVSTRFYAALNNMLAGAPASGAIAPLWLDAPGVTALHPIGGRDTGRDVLTRAFDGVASLASGGAVRLKDQAIAVFGDTAVETGIEIGMATLAGQEVPLDYRVTNVYTRTRDGWRMVHHHTDLSMPIIELLGRLKK